MEDAYQAIVTDPSQVDLDKFREAKQFCEDEADKAEGFAMLLEPTAKAAFDADKADFDHKMETLFKDYMECSESPHNCNIDQYKADAQAASESSVKMAPPGVHAENLVPTKAERNSLLQENEENQEKWGNFFCAANAWGAF